MEWLKKGLVYSPNAKNWWNKKYAMYPTPFLIEKKNIIRVFFGTVDDNFFGRTSYVDLNADHPEIIMYNPNEYILDIGENGTFDDCGATPASVIQKDGKLQLYYSGFCRSFQTPYHIFSGIAISEDYLNFEKISKVPFMDRTSMEYFDRAGHAVIFDEGIYKCWYVSGVKWETINSELFQNKKMPVHTIRFASSIDSIHWVSLEEPCIPFLGEDEFGFGRPWVYKEGDIYRMWYSVRSRSKPYCMGYAESLDGINWSRKDAEVGIEKSDVGWDSSMICYGAVIRVKNKTYMFYNGNNHGETGFGFAELIKW